MKEIIFLGNDLTWDEAIDKALDLGMHVPNYEIMSEIIKRFKLDVDYLGYNKYLCSTTYAYKTNEYVDPHKEVSFPYAEDHEDDEVETIEKTSRCGAYAVPKDITLLDIQSGNYTIDTMINSSI